MSIQFSNALVDYNFIFCMNFAFNANLTVWYARHRELHGCYNLCYVVYMFAVIYDEIKMYIYIDFIEQHFGDVRLTSLFDNT